MFIKFLLVAISSTLFFFTGSAYAEVGQVVFADGDVRVAGKAVTAGASVNEGDQLQTGANGHLYVKTIDNGFFILRPSSTGRIIQYHIDSLSPENTRIKLEVTEGVTRHISGEAVKAAKQNFRLNTPVAAIGVRGTDFTVFTSSETSSVSVASGGVIVSPFTSTCIATGQGPCGGSTSRELFASQTGLVLQIVHGQNVPQILRENKNAPDSISPPRSDEPGQGSSSGKETIKTSSNLDFAPLKNGSLESFSSPPAQRVTPPLIWGRWQFVLGQDKEIKVSDLLQSHQLIATNAYYALMRSREGLWQRPEQNIIGFSLQSSQAVLKNEPTGQISAVSIENGILQLDFAKSSFSTRIDLVGATERIPLQSQGQITPDGILSGNSQFSRPTNMAVEGAINTGNASAAYLFRSRIDERRIASGVTFWTR